MYSLQLRDAKNSLALKAISGQCTNSNGFVAVLNEAMRRLDRRGNFFNTEQLIEFCVYNGCVTFPRKVGTVLGIRPCAQGSLEIKNNWYNILGDRNCNSFFPGFVMRDYGTAPCFNEISGNDGKYLRVYPTKREDVGKTIVFFGTDGNGQPLQEKIGNEWQRGITLTIQAPYVQSATLVKRITEVVKDRTQANILVYEYEASTGYQRDLALYEPSETNPSYRKSIIEGFCSIPGSATTNGVQYKKVEALVKLQFVAVESDEDFLPIDCLDAIKFMIQCIRQEEAGNFGNAEVFKQKAIEELNFELRNRSPSNQTTVRVNATPFLENPL